MGNQQGRRAGEENSVEDVESTLEDKPVQLIEVNDEGEFSVGEAAKELLKSLGPEKVCVVAVAGLYRTGKSSLVNFLLGRQSGFTVGPTVSRCTRGIWMWGKPRRATLQNGDTCWILVLDTEGLGGLEADSSYDLRIFSLATLLCSTLVYNSLGTIDENAITSLSFVAQLTQHIRINKSDGDDFDDGELDAMEFHNFFPTFAWVLRDFALDLVDEHGGSIEPDQYLESALKPQVGFDEQTLERNRIRQMLTAFFTERKCFPLVRPVVDEDKLQEIDTIPYEELRPEFRDTIEEIGDFLYFHHVKPKVVNNVALNGSSFAALCEQYIEAICSGGVPTITSAWEEVMEKECEDASKRAIKVFDDEIDLQVNSNSRKGALEVDMLVDIHARAFKKALQMFESRAGGEQAAHYQETLEMTLLQRLGELQSSNYKKSLNQCALVITEMFKTSIEPKLSDTNDAGYLANDSSPYEELQRDLDMITSQYRGSARVTGPAQGEALATFFSGQVLQAVKNLTVKMDEQHEIQVENVREKIQTVKSKLASVEAREKVYNESIDKARDEAIAYKTKNMMLEQQQQATGARVNGLMKELQSRSKKVKELEIQLEETSEAYASETHWQSTLTDKLEKVQRDHDKKHEELVNLQNEHSDHKQTHEERHNELSQKLAEHEVKLTNTHSEKEEVKAQLNDALTEISNKELQLHQSKQEGVELSSKLENLQTELEREKKNVQDLITERKAMEAKLTQEVESCKTTAEDMRLAQQTELKGLNDAINTAKQDFGAVNAEKGELKKQVREYQRRSQQQEKSMNDLRTQGQKKVAQLQSQLEKHKLDHTKIRNELQQKTSKELQLEMQLDHEKEMRETAIADKDTQIFSFQKDITEKSKTMKKKEVKIQQLTTLIEEKDNELVALQAAKSVFTMEKEKQQVLWETSMSEHFNKIHENEHKYNELEMQFEEFKESQEVEKAEIQRELLEYKTIVQQVQTTKQGLLRKQTRTRRMFQTWSVKHFTLVGGALLYKDPNSAAANAEKAFQMNSTTTITGSTTVKYGFSIQTLDNELVLQAIDQDDMNSWMLELKESVSAMSAKAYIDPAQVAAFGKLENGDEQDINEES